MMVEDRASPAHDVVTVYKYDISNPGVYETNHNRLLYSLRFEDDDADHERDGGEEVLEERWWTYDRAGRVRRVIERWPADDAETFQTTRLDYTGAGQLWLARRFTTEYNLLGESWNEPVMQQILEFRYSGGDRWQDAGDIYRQDAGATVLTRERDPETTEVLEDGDHWREYMGSACVKDLEVDPDGGAGGDPAFVPGVRWVQGVGLAGFVLPDSGSGERRRFDTGPGRSRIRWIVWH